MTAEIIQPEHIREVRRDSAAFLAVALLTELINTLRRKGVLSNAEGMEVVVKAVQSVDNQLLAELQADRAGVPVQEASDAVRSILLRAAGMQN